MSTYYEEACSITLYYAPTNTSENPIKDKFIWTQNLCAAKEII